MPRSRLTCQRTVSIFKRLVVSLVVWVLIGRHVSVLPGSPVALAAFPTVATPGLIPLAPVLTLPANRFSAPPATSITSPWPSGLLLAWRGRNQAGQAAVLAADISKVETWPVVRILGRPSVGEVGEILQWISAQELVFSDQADQGHRLRLARVYSQTARTLVSLFRDTWIQSVHPAPDRRFLTYLQEDESGYFRWTSVWVVGLTGGTARKLVEDAAGLGWSLDGRSVTYYLHGQAWERGLSGGLRGLPPPRLLRRAKDWQIALEQGTQDLSQVACCSFLPELQAYILKGIPSASGGINFYLLPVSGSPGRILMHFPTGPGTDALETTSEYEVSPDKKWLAVVRSNDSVLVALETPAKYFILPAGSVFLGFDPTGQERIIYLNRAHALVLLDLVSGRSLINSRVSGDLPASLRRGHNIDLYWP